jgi:hypothetical protein
MLAWARWRPRQKASGELTRAGGPRETGSEGIGTWAFLGYLRSSLVPEPGHQGLRRRQVGGEGHLMHVADPHEGLNVGLVGLGAQGVLQEDDRQDPPLGHPGPDLLVPASGARRGPSPREAPWPPGPGPPWCRWPGGESGPGGPRCLLAKAAISSFLASWAMRARYFTGPL